ncbi:MAG: putative phosphonate metabolism protein [Pseudorhodobacter sp.]|jgi:putative phosphonate metabolism protein
MDQMKRYAIYYTPQAGAFAAAAAAWLGWDLAGARPVAQPSPDLPRPLAEVTAVPRKYGFHGTIKPPFRLADGVSFTDLDEAVAGMASGLKPVAFPALQIINLHGFLALVPQGDPAALQALAGEVVRVLDPYRATLTETEIARRRPERLTPRQRDLLATYGYPYVMEELRFHLTLSGPLSDAEVPVVTQAAAQHFAQTLPQPFRLGDLSLCGEDDQGRFHLLHRYALMA